MGFTYPDKFTHLNTFGIQVAQRCSDNGGPVFVILKYCNKKGYSLILTNSLIRTVLALYWYTGVQIIENPLYKENL